MTRELTGDVLISMSFNESTRRCRIDFYRDGDLLEKIETYRKVLEIKGRCNGIEVNQYGFETRAGIVKITDVKFREFKGSYEVKTW